MFKSGTVPQAQNISKDLRGLKTIHNLSANPSSILIFKCLWKIKMMQCNMWLDSCLIKRKISISREERNHFNEESETNLLELASFMWNQFNHD